MRIRREWWYVIVLVILILVLMIVFRDDMAFSPVKKSKNNLENNFLNLDDSLDTREQKMTAALKDAVTEVGK